MMMVDHYRRLSAILTAIRPQYLTTSIMLHHRGGLLQGQTVAGPMNVGYRLIGWCTLLKNYFLLLSRCRWTTTRKPVDPIAYKYVPVLSTTYPTRI
jgi:hypothetical protein